MGSKTITTCKNCLAGKRCSFHQSDPKKYAHWQPNYRDIDYLRTKSKTEKTNNAEL